MSTKSVIFENVSYEENSDAKTGKAVIRVLSMYEARISSSNSNAFASICRAPSLALKNNDTSGVNSLSFSRDLLRVRLGDFEFFL